MHRSVNEGSIRNNYDAKNNGKIMYDGVKSYVLRKGMLRWFGHEECMNKVRKR